MSPAQCLVPYLKHTGCSSIDRIFISHADDDHFNGISDSLATVPARQVMVNRFFRQHAFANLRAGELLARLEHLDCPVSTIAAGQKIPLDRDVAIEVLWPDEQSPADTNNSCLVLRLTIAGWRILFTGDIQSPAHEALLLHPELLAADILVAPHHGSAEKTTARLIEAIDPPIVICSSGAKLSRKQRQFDEMVSGRRLYRTNWCGAVSVVVNSAGRIRIQTFR